MSGSDLALGILITAIAVAYIAHVVIVNPPYSQRYSICVDGVNFIVDPFGYLEDHQKIWTAEHPEYYIWRRRGSRVWTISRQEENPKHWLPDQIDLRVVCHAGKRKAARALSEFLFDMFVAPSIVTPDAELLVKYGESVEHSGTGE